MDRRFRRRTYWPVGPCWHHMWYGPYGPWGPCGPYGPPPEWRPEGSKEETELLKEHIAMLKDELKEAEKRLEELEKGK
jgi:hypothetical protein